MRNVIRSPGEMESGREERLVKIGEGEREREREREREIQRGKELETDSEIGSKARKAL